MIQIVRLLTSLSGMLQSGLQGWNSESGNVKGGMYTCLDLRSQRMRVHACMHACMHACVYAWSFGSKDCVYAQACMTVTKRRTVQHQTMCVGCR